MTATRRRFKGGLRYVLGLRGDGLGFRWQDVRKGVFIDGVSETISGALETLSPYLVEFTSDGEIKEKEYPAGYEVGGSQCRPVIIITHDESIFSANDGKHQAWVPEVGLSFA